MDAHGTVTLGWEWGLQTETLWWRATCNICTKMWSFNYAQRISKSSRGSPDENQTAGLRSARVVLHEERTASAMNSRGEEIQVCRRGERDGLGLGLGWVCQCSTIHWQGTGGVSPSLAPPDSPRPHSRAGNATQHPEGWLSLSRLLDSKNARPAPSPPAATHQPPSSNADWRLPTLLLTCASPG